MTTTAVATQPATVRFTEEMLGHVTFGETDYNRGAATDRPGSSFFKFHLTIAVDDIHRFGSDPMRQAGAFGWVECDALGGRLPVERLQGAHPELAILCTGPWQPYSFVGGD